MLQAHSLTERFQERARHSRALNFFFNNAGRISGGGYILGNIILTARQGLNFDMAAVAGGLFLLNGLSLSLSKNHPSLVKVGGLATMAGSLVLAASAYGQNAFMAQVLSMTSPFLAGVMMLRTERTETDSCKKPGFLQKYPRATAAAIQFVTRPLLAWSALQRGDGWQAVTALSWGLAGDTGLAAMDSNLKSRVMGMTDKPSPHQLAPA